jgi:hypothetical protein
MVLVGCLSRAIHKQAFWMIQLLLTVGYLVVEWKDCCGKAKLFGENFRLRIHPQQLATELCFTGD